MKPETSSNNFNLEQPSIEHGSNIERAPSIPSPEQGVEKSAEHFEQRAELSAIAADAGLASVVPAPVITTTNAATNSIVGDTPLVANDDDLIEKEWVDKAKKIVADTRHDPYKQEEAVSILQVDYLKKRYGREIGAAD